MSVGVKRNTSSAQVPYRSKSLLLIPMSKVISRSLHCASSQKLPKAQKNKTTQTKVCVVLLARCEGLEPPTYWFVASHSIQLS